MSNDIAKNSGSTQLIMESRVKEPRKATVVLLNDDYTSMEFVVRILVEIFRKSSQDAMRIMLNVHEKGRGVCGVYPLEIAETKVTQVHAKARAEGFPLRCIIEFA